MKHKSLQRQPAAHQPSSEPATSSPDTARPGAFESLQRTLGNQALQRILSNETPTAPRSVQRNFLKNLFGGGKKKDDFQITVTGGRAGNQDRFGENNATEVQYAEPRSWAYTDFFSSPEWRAHFLSYVGRKNLSDAISDALVTVFYETIVRKIDKSNFSREEALAYINEVLVPNAGDPAVQKFIAARTGSGSGLDSLIALCSNDNSFYSGTPSGKKVLGDKATKIYMNIVDVYNGYRAYLNTPEGKADQTRPLTQAQFYEAPVIGGTRATGPETGGPTTTSSANQTTPPQLNPNQQGRPLPPLPSSSNQTVPPQPIPSQQGRPLPPIPGSTPKKQAPPRPPRNRWVKGNTPADHRTSPKQKAILQQAERKAAQDAEANRKKAIALIVQAGVEQKNAETVLGMLIEYIRSATATINFNASHNKFDLFERIEGYSPVWMSDLEKEEANNPGYLDKRNQVEQRYFGFTDDPRKEGSKSDRPVYAGANVGDAVSGAAEQYGYSYFELNDEVKERSTYSHRDTFSGSNAANAQGAAVNNIGTLAHLEGVIADMGVDKLKQLIAQVQGTSGARGLGENNYIELHVFGGIDWSKDIKRIVIDSSVVPPGSRLEKHLLRFANHYNIPVAYYDHKKWVMEASTDLKSANQKYKPEEQTAPQPQQVKIGTQKAQDPGTIVNTQVIPARQEVIITQIVQEEPNSPVTKEQETNSAQGPNVRDLASKLEGKIKFG